MGFFDRIFRGADKPAATKAATGAASTSVPFLGSIGSNAGAYVNQASAMSVPAVYACVSIRSEDVARCAPGLYRRGSDGSREQVKDHPVARLFARPNETQTWFEFVEQMHAGLLLRGNAYAVILRDARGSPQELIPINPDHVTVLEAGDGSIFYQMTRSGLFLMNKLRGLPLAIPAENVFHLRGLAFHITVGANRVNMARDVIGVAISQILQAARWIANGALPSGLLKTTKQLSDTAADRLSKMWKAMFSGPDNVGAVPILEDGLDWVPMKLTSADLQFLEQSKFSVEQIARWFRMPPHKLGMIEALNKTNQLQADQTYVNETIMPDLDRWEQKFVLTFDLDKEGLEVDFDESRLLRADVLTRLNIGRLGVLSGLMSPEEWRISEGRPPSPQHGVLRAPVNLAELGSDTTGTAPDGAGRPGPKDPKV